MVYTYGNWNKQRSVGIGPLGFIPTIILFLASIVAVILMMTSFSGAVIFLMVIVLLLSLFLIKIDTRPLIELLVVFMLWTIGKKKGQHIYRSHLFALSPLASSSARLPGIGFNLDTYEIVYNNFKVCVIVNKILNHYSIVLISDIEGGSLVNQSQVDVWVAKWGSWLNYLSYENSIIGSNVVVESKPYDTSHFLQKTISSLKDNDGKNIDAINTMRTIADQYTRSNIYKSTAYITVTFSSLYRNRRRSLDQMNGFIQSKVGTIINQVSDCGLGFIRPISMIELGAVIKSAYSGDLASNIIEGLVDSEKGDSILWRNSGPLAHQEFWNYYIHDNLKSVSWVMREAPKGIVTSNVLSKLLSVDHSVYSKRVIMFYRAYSSEASSRIVEKDKRKNLFKLQEDKQQKAENVVAYKSAEKTAFDEAYGSMLTRFSMVITITADIDKPLWEMYDIINTLSASTRMRFSVAYGSQASAFLSSLPVGIILPNYIGSPYNAIKEML